MLDYIKFRDKYKTNEVVNKDCKIINHGLESIVKLPLQVRRAQFGDLLKDYCEHYSNKPKFFKFRLIPNVNYKYEKYEWVLLEETMRNIINSVCSIEWT